MLTDRGITLPAGATGLVGSRLVAKLSSLGHTVRVLTRNASAARSKLPYGRVEIFDPSRWAEAVKGSDGVINLAGVQTHLTKATEPCTVSNMR